MSVTSSLAAPRRPRLRHSRFWTPLAVAIVVIFFTGIAGWLEAPAPGNSDYLSPDAAGGHGSAKLSAALESDGVTVDRHTDAADALQVAAQGNATLFLPAPDYLNSDERLMLRDLRENVPQLRIVSVLPSGGMLTDLGLQNGYGRIATKTVSPQGGSSACDNDAIENAGDAAVLRQRYVAQGQNDPGWKFCYDDSLAWVSHSNGGEDFVVGSNEPFSDEYFGQSGNQALTTSLLGTHDTVVWLDKHSTTPVAPPTPPETPSGSAEEPSRAPIDYGETETNPIYQTLPGWMWVGLVGLLLLGIMAALWKGRRLGPPVTEPLPVTVPGAETVHGRARLYRRGQAYGEAMEALRAGALERIRRALRLSSQSTPETVVTTIAARTNWPTETVRQVLYGAAPSSENELLEATAALDALEAAVENDTPRGRN